ncbi:unnamed protein product [Cuscuta europaea]|uniref:Uncharacterized protein n=1 Tax=Cuscuta europaea TaxID=41803 RepID=A0A9P1E5A3_CUSEU|nr:unnamed protein product [Cuscuta europaea]
MDKRLATDSLPNQNMYDDWRTKDVWDELSMTQSVDDQKGSSDKSSSSGDEEETLICLYGMHHVENFSNDCSMAGTTSNDNDEVLSSSSNNSFHSSCSSVDMEALLLQFENFQKDHLLLMNENCRLQVNLIVAQAQMGEVIKRNDFLELENFSLKERLSSLTTPISEEIHHNWKNTRLGFTPLSKPFEDSPKYSPITKPTTDPQDTRNSNHQQPHSQTLSKKRTQSSSRPKSKLPYNFNFLNNQPNQRLDWQPINKTNNLSQKKLITSNAHIPSPPHTRNNDHKHIAFSNGNINPNGYRPISSNSNGPKLVWMPKRIQGKMPTNLWAVTQNQ